MVAESVLVKQQLLIADANVRPTCARQIVSSPVGTLALYSKSRLTYARMPVHVIISETYIWFLNLLIAVKQVVPAQWQV